MGVSRIVFVLEVVFGVLLSVGVGLVVGALSHTAGVGAALIACAVIGLAFVLAWERGHVE